MRVASSPRLLRYFSVVIRWLVILAVVFILTFSIGNYICGKLFQKSYAATSLIQILPDGANQPDMQAEVAAVESPKILMSVIYDLGLDHAWARRVFNSTEDELSSDQALAYMNTILKVDVKAGTNILAITTYSDLPKEAADIANAIANRYKIRHDADEFEREAHASTPNAPVHESSIRIVSRAMTPSAPATSSQFIFLILAASILSILAASFSEMLLLFARAGERSGNY